MMTKTFVVPAGSEISTAIVMQLSIIDPRMTISKMMCCKREYE